MRAPKRSPKSRAKKKRRWLSDLLFALGLGALLVLVGQGIKSLVLPDEGESSQLNAREGKDAGDEDASLERVLDEELPEQLQEALGSTEFTDLDATAQQTLESVLGEAASVKTTQLEAKVPEAATQVLEDYQDAGAQLAYASYLDALGRAWGCVVQGDGWVETCVVQTGESEATSRVDVVRFDRESWAETVA